MIKQYLMPPIVLAAICSVIAFLLALANDVTEERIAKVRAEKTQNTLTQAFGEGEYTQTEFANDNVEQTYVKSDGTVIFEIISSGYNKDSIDLLIGVNESGICGIGVVSLTETAGVGTQVGELSFLEQFFGADSQQIEDVDAISGATYSSNGVKLACTQALSAFEEYSEADL